MMNPRALIAVFLGFADQLKFRNLFLIIIALFMINLFIPDFIPLIDEIILGLMAIILANLKKERVLEQQGNTIEGEVIDVEEKNN